MRSENGHAPCPPRPKPAGPASPEAVPADLRAVDQWVTWRYEWVNGRWTKVPSNARTGANASSTDSRDSSSFDAAYAAFRRGGYDGVGFVFAADGEHAGIDLDDCRNPDGTLDIEALQIVMALNSYTEVSPSGEGVKIYVRGRKPAGSGCRQKNVPWQGEIEIYDKARFFCVTGEHFMGTPTAVMQRQAELSALCERFWPPQALARPAALPHAVEMSDQQLLDRMFASASGGKIKRLWSGDTSEYGGDESAADMALCCYLAFWTRCDRTRMDRMFRASGLYREKWERPTYRDPTLDKAIASCTQTYEPAHSPSRPDGDHKQGVEVAPLAALEPAVIRLGTDEHRVVEETIEALAADPALFKRGLLLVRVLRGEDRKDDVKRAAGSATIAGVPAANLRERMTRHVRFLRKDEKGNWNPAHPPSWLVGAVDARGEWPGIRQLLGFSDAPVLRPDGTVWQTPGYDETTGVLYVPTQKFPAIPDRPTAAEVRAAVATLDEVICDFRFEAPEHRAAWFAALLSPLARFAYEGPTPLFLIDANIRGAGKGLMAQTISHIVSGREMPVSSYAHDTDEMRKKITCVAIAGDSLVLLDNLEGKFGNDALDRALTSTRWRDRILGKSEQVELPLMAVWFATGNNVVVGADTARRIIHIRLDVLEEHPEDRADFRHPNLLLWIDKNRPKLLVAALTIVAGYLRAGRPPQGLKPYGSYEGWSDLVRSAVVWAGLPDPCLTRDRLTDLADANENALEQIIPVWKAMNPGGEGVIIAPLIAHLYPQQRDQLPTDAHSVAMRAALENLVACPPGKVPTTRQVANRLKAYRRRVVDGVYLDMNPKEYDRDGAVWRLYSKSTGKPVCDSATLQDSF